MKRVLAVLALVSLFPSPAAAHPPFGRQLHYAGTKSIGNDAVPVTIDIDIGRLDSDKETWIVIDEHLGNRDLGITHVTLDASGVVERRAEALTFEEATVLDMVALQFEDVDGVDAGDHWDRSGWSGARQTHYLVRHVGDGVIDFSIERSVDAASGGGRVSGAMRYDARTAAPTAIELAGDRLAFSVRLVGDSFQAPNG